MGGDQQQRKRPKSRSGAMAIERLENRLLLDGKVVAFFVAGGGGGTFPESTAQYVDELLVRLQSETNISEGRVYYTNWNSPDFDDPYGPSGNPSILTPNPASDDLFVAALQDVLINQYDDNDTIILVGHSWGADSLIKVARRLEGTRQIDLLVLFDRVGSAGFRDSPGADASLYFKPSNVEYVFNRWQTGTASVIPVLNNLSASGELYSRTDFVQRDFGIRGQIEQSYQKNADGSDDWHRPSEVETLNGIPLMFQNPLRPDDVYYAKLVDKDVEIAPGIIVTMPDGVKVRSLEHSYVPKDAFINAQLVRVLNGVIPQGPIIEATVSPAGVVDEGTTIRIDASASYDPNVGESIQEFRWSASDPRVVLPQGSLDLSVAIGDNFELPDGALTVTLEAWDGPRDAAGSMKSSREFTITARNVAPRGVVINGPDRYVRGFEVPLTATFEDPGFLDTHTGIWSVAGSQAAGGFLFDFPTPPSRITTVQPLYEAEGSYTVEVTVDDDDGGSGQAAAATLQIDAVGLAANPDDPALEDLLVGGSTGFDTIAVRPGAAADTYVVLMNGVEYGPFPVTGVIRIAGQGGDDRIEIGAGDLTQIRRQIIVDAGAGADRVVLVDDGRAAAADYLVTPTSVSIMEPAAVSHLGVAAVSGFGGLVYSDSTEFLDVLGTEGVNLFDVQPSLDTAYSLDGNGPLPGAVEASRGDYLKLDTKTTFAADPRGFGLDTSGRRLTIEARGRGRWDFTKGTGHQSVSFESFERFNHVDVVAAAADAGKTGSPVVHVLDSETLEPLFTIPAASTFGPNYRGGVRVATGDLDNDGLPDVAVAPGRMAAAMVKVFNGSPQLGVQGAEIRNQRIAARSTFGARYTGGVNIAVGDVTGDTLNDVIVSRSRGPAVVKVFENTLVAGSPFAQLGLTAARAFNAFPQPRRYQGGSSVAVGDVGGLGKQQIVVGSGSGMRGLVRVFDVRIPSATYAALMQVVDPTVPAIRGGLNVATGDLDGDGHAEIVTGSGAAGWSRVRVYNGLDGSHAFALQTGTGLAATIPARVAVRSIDGDTRMAVFATWGADARRGYQVVRMDAALRESIDDLRVSGRSLSGGGINIG